MDQQIPGVDAVIDSIIFKLEHDGVYFPVPEWEYNQYRYRCMSCFAACGLERDTFKTTFARAKFLKDGPTQEQQDQMSDHARQHSIMYLWAKGVK
jgi:hypothetical protein